MSAETLVASRFMEPPALRIFWILPVRKIFWSSEMVSLCWVIWMSILCFKDANLF